MKTLDREVACVFLDDVQQHFGLDQLLGLVPDQIQRIEIIDRGTMVRVYTRRHTQKLMGSRGELPRIMLIKELGAKGCF